MKKIVTICFSILLSGLLIISCKPNDQKLQTQVETVLTTAFSGIKTSVKDGVATLEGTVDSEESKMAIEKAAAISGIKSVVNNIVVQQSAPVVINTDDVLNTTLTTAFATAGFKDITVAIKDGEVTLTGDVKRDDLTKILQVANESNPKKVINNLTIK